MPVIEKPLKMARKYISACVSNGDLAVDATAGNGHDTLFLARLVGANGRVISFDKQKKAIENTYRRLKAENMLPRVDLIQDGHEHMANYIHSPVAAVMFNLGYLPGGDHTLITRPQTTLDALGASLWKLRPGGVITIVCYTGHEGGKEEKAALLTFLQGLEQKSFTVLHYAILNQVNAPPSLLAIEKRA
ncbi:MAG: tRNA (mnm(5)s(2)U34)-methyltransferase [Dethiobacteria bacterium]|jgi:predicted methyltransferase